eukprot:TRINITY_DN19328_c0_g1_i1.p1 TRINITY_DN19328_c0_g1~~TRINITY_DN19328_c0_g1_i1.p1  ORF type:complete len:351 (+),score=39.60 TRINITY_DN19328_c0_g1_i1:64-1116(+)
MWLLLLLLLCTVGVGGQATETVTLTLSETLSETKTLRTVTDTLRTRTISDSLSQSWSVSSTESLPTSTVTDTISLSLRTRTLTHPITVTSVPVGISVSLFLTPYAVRYPGDIPFAAESWRHRFASAFTVSSSRVRVYWSPDSSDTNISVAVTFTGDCEPCCGCVPSDPGFRRNGLTNDQLHHELLWESSCCPGSCGLEGERVDSGFCSDLGILGPDTLNMNCGSYPEEDLCLTNSRCGWGGSTGCAALPQSNSTIAPSSDDENFLPVIVSAATLVVVIIVVCLLYSYFCRSGNSVATPHSSYEEAPNNHVINQPIQNKPEELSILPPASPSPRRAQGHTITRSWLDKGWV